MDASQYRPPVGFYYTVTLLDMGGKPGAPIDAGFQEVSGISARREVEKIVEGGENRFVHQAPVRTTYEDLVLKRGLVVWSSPLGIWCRNHLSGNLSKKIEPRNISVQLLDAATPGEQSPPIMQWFFANAYPVEWKVDPLRSEDSAIAIESITLTYNYFKVIEDLGSSYLKKSS